jgi:oligopeptide/dipeptide ABC transporter ATP-binding protein
MSSIADRISIFYAGRVVESGPRDELLQHPRHPYTRALLDALPHPEAALDTPLIAIKGTPPSPQQIPSGCPYHPRCSYAIDLCTTDDPPLAPVDGRRLACHVDPFAGVE